MRDNQVSTLKTAIERLKEDFEYNLTLIAGRDEELVQYDATLTNLQKGVKARDMQVSDAKIEVANAESELELAKSHIHEKDVQIEGMRRDLLNQAQGAQFNSEEALRRQQESFDRVRYEYERKLEQSAAELKRLQSDQSAAIDEVLRARDAADDEMRADLRSATSSARTASERQLAAETAAAEHRQ